MTDPCGVEVIVVQRGAIERRLRARDSLVHPKDPFRIETVPAGATPASRASVSTYVLVRRSH